MCVSSADFQRDARAGQGVQDRVLHQIVEQLHQQFAVAANENAVAAGRLQGMAGVFRHKG